MDISNNILLEEGRRRALWMNPARVSPKLLDTNKTIYMTYKSHPPSKVFLRWKTLNKDYNIEFSLDEDCIKFLREHFNEYIVNLFNRINRGMYKADLWRLCKLYINGGVYADIDLVPYIDIDSLDKNITFYSCLSYDKNAIFQAFIINFTKPKNPLILLFLISFILNEPFNIYENGATIDMYNCISYNLNGIKLLPEKKYVLNVIKILVKIGSSDTNIKYIDLHYFPQNIDYYIVLIPNSYKDEFEFTIKNNFLIVKRIDLNCGWGEEHFVNICIKSEESIFLFEEKLEFHNYYVSYNKSKILDSRDNDYVRDIGFNSNPN
jgi:hypothetical protein